MGRGAGGNGAPPAVAVERPIIVLGAPRSGTTVVSQLLQDCPELHVEIEPRLVWKLGNEARSDQLRRHHATSDVVERLRTEFASRLEASGRARLAEKTPSNSLRPHFVDAVFPDAVYLHVIRNGYECVAAMRAFSERTARGLTRNQRRNVVRRLRETSPRHWLRHAGELTRRILPAQRVPVHGPRLAGIEEMSAELGPMETAALQWVACTVQASAFGDEHPDRYVELRFEELTARSWAETLRQLDVRPPADLARHFESRFDAGRPISRMLTDAELELVRPHVDPIGAWLDRRRTSG